MGYDLDIFVVTGIYRFHDNLPKTHVRLRNVDVIERMVIVDDISYLIYLTPDQQESSGTYLGKYTGRSSQSLCCRCICISLRQSSCRRERKKAIVGIVMCPALGMTIPTHNVINLFVSATELGTTVRSCKW